MGHKILWALIPLVAAFVLDLLIGDPKWIYHPVRVMGNIIHFLELWLRKIFPKSKNGELWSGIVLAMVFPVLSIVFAWIVLFVARKISFELFMAVDTFLCYQMIAAKSLKVESDRVKDSLLKGDIDGARKWLSYIVGRDTANLNEFEIIKATVETVSENTSDGIIAPLFYIGIMGAPLCYFYKAVNTLDSMVGYKNERYMYFGRVSAKLDDVLNYIPSRLSGFFIIVSAFVLGMDYKSAYRIFKRDRRNHSSPNSAQTESACAGAIGIQLGGGGCYGGVFVKKQTIGDDTRKPKVDDIDKSQRLMMCSSVIACFCVVVVRLAVSILWR